MIVFGTTVRQDCGTRQQKSNVPINHLISNHFKVQLFLFLSRRQFQMINEYAKSIRMNGAKFAERFLFDKKFSF